MPPQAGPACKALGAALRDAPTVAEGPRRVHRVSEPSQDRLPEACRWLADESEASLPHLQVPRRQRQDGRPSNLAARAVEEARRRTQVIPPLGEEASLVQVVCAVLRRGRERWGKKPSRACAQHHMRALRQS